MPKYSVVTLTYGNRTNALHSCIESVLKHTKGEFEYFIIDNDSGQQTRNLLSSYSTIPGIYWIPTGKNIGTSARNEALTRAKGEYIVIVDDDVIVHEGYIEAMEKYFTDDVCLVGGAGSRFCGWDKGIWDGYLYHAGDYVDFVTSWNCMFRNKGYLYDVNLKSLRDESDLELQMKQDGWRIRQSECNARHNCIRMNDGKSFDADTEYFVNKWKPIDAQGKIKWEQYHG